MDFKGLRDKILPNIKLYNENEVEIVVTKLLDFLILNDEKLQEAEKEKESLLEEIKSLEENISRINKADSVEETESTDTLDEKEKDIIGKIVNRTENLIKDLKEKERKNRIYHQYILSVCKKIIFRYADSDYYIIRTDDQDFRELRQLFLTDEKLQELCENNIRALENDPFFQDISEYAKQNEITEIKDTETAVFSTVREEPDEVIEQDTKPEKVITLADMEKAYGNDAKQLKAKFIDVLNQYKNK